MKIPFFKNTVTNYFSMFVRLVQGILVTRWLISLGVDEAIAKEDACRMEHTMSQESFAAIKRFAEDFHKNSL